MVNTLRTLVTSGSGRPDRVFDRWTSDGTSEPVKMRQPVPVRILSPVNIRRVLGVGENCCVFISAASSVLDLGVTDFWELARQAQADVASGQTRASVGALISHLRHVVGNGLDVAASSEFMAVVFAHEALCTNLGHLP